MNFSQVRGYNAYSQFSARIRQAVMTKAGEASTPAAEETDDSSKALYSEPVDKITISDSARQASKELAAWRDMTKENLSIVRDRSPHIEFREWARTAGSGKNTFNGSITRNVPGSVMNKAIAGSGITVGDDEQYSVTVDVQSTIAVTSRNTEKAKAIQELLLSTPSDINWGLLLAKLPPM